MGVFQFKSESLFIGEYGRVFYFRLCFFAKIDGGLIIYRCFDAFETDGLTLLWDNCAYLVGS